MLNPKNNKKKVCKKCKKEKLLLRFHKSPSNKDGRKTICAECLKCKKTKEKENLLKNNLKLCSKCKEIKALNFFSKSSQTKSGYNCYCKECVSIKTLKTKVREKLKKEGYKLCNKCNLILKLPNFYLDKNNQYSCSCKECQKDIKKKYNKENKEQLSKKRKERYYLNRERNIQDTKNWSIKNRDKVRKNKKNYKLRQKNNPSFIIKNRISNRIWYALFNQNINKKEKTINYIGISIKHLKEYLEFQFDKDMNWNNYGAYWEIDHIIPCNCYNLSLESNQLKCFNYKNLRPCECSINRSKNDKIDFSLIKKYNIIDLLPDNLLKTYYSDFT